MLTDEIMYQAILDKNVAYEGSFITAVKTTGIFCRPTCTARKPKKENVAFVKTTKEAIVKDVLRLLYLPDKQINISL